MTLGLGKKVSTLSMVAIFIAPAAYARPQDQPAKNPEVIDPYSDIKGTGPVVPDEKPAPVQDPVANGGAEKTETAEKEDVAPAAPEVPGAPEMPEMIETPVRHAESGTGDLKNDQGESIVIDNQDADIVTDKVCSCQNRWGAHYRERRTSWGTLFSLGYSTYMPKNYTPDFAVNQTYSTFYGSSAPGSYEGSFVLKKNISIGSLGAGLSVASMNASGQNSTSLSVIPIRLGAYYYMDNLSSEPYVVPYFGGGAYTAIYKESSSGQSVSGNSSINYFYSLGVEFQLNWLDDYGARYSYEDFGMENAFLYLEAQGLGGTVSAGSPNLGNPFFFNAGLRMEF